MSKFQHWITNALSTLSVRRLLYVVMVVWVGVTLLVNSASAQAPKPDGPLALILIRDAISALNHANLTGNYTVLRDYSSPKFCPQQHCGEISGYISNHSDGQSQPVSNAVYRSQNQQSGIDQKWYPAAA